MTKAPQEVLKEYVKSQQFSSTTETMSAIKEMFRYPSGRLDSSAGITKFPNVMTGDRWANTLRTPTEFGLVDPPKARFILEHQAHFSTVSTAIVDFFFRFAHFFFNFFEAAMTSSRAFFGCLLRGVTFRLSCMA